MWSAAGPGICLAVWSLCESRTRARLIVGIIKHEALSFPQIANNPKAVRIKQDNHGFFDT